VRNQLIVRQLGQNGLVDGIPLQLERRSILESGQSLLADTICFISGILKLFVYRTAHCSNTMFAPGSAHRMSFRLLKSGVFTNFESQCTTDGDGDSGSRAK
jgi:hypothetical protein